MVSFSSLWQATDGRACGTQVDMETMSKDITISSVAKVCDLMDSKKILEVLTWELVGLEFFTCGLVWPSISRVLLFNQLAKVTIESLYT